MTVSAALRAEDVLDADLAELRARTRGDPEISVALLDGPVDLSHDSLREANITSVGEPAASPEAVKHGTHVASVIFGQDDDGAVRGIAPESRGLSLPLFKDVDALGAPVSSQAELAAAVRAATEAGADIINVSAGEWAPDRAVEPGLEEAISEAVDRGVIVIAAAGLGGCARPQVPASLPGVLAVAVDNPSAEAGGNCLLAPGDDIAGATPGGGVTTESGSSYATAIVSGVAALLLSVRPEPERVLAALRRAGPRLDIGEALRFLEGAAASQPDPLKGVRFRVTQHALEEKYRGVREQDFGTVTIRLSKERSYRIADFRYPVDGGRTGVRLVPVSDKGEPGSAVLDALLRREQGLATDEDLYAFLSYIHPEEHSYDAGAVVWTSKLQLGHRHVGAYLGAGRTTQALLRPERWRGESAANMEFNADLHPANVQIVSLAGVPQAVLNRNARIVDGLIIAGARIPERADDLTDCRTVDLTTTLQYYRDLIRRMEYLEDLAWYTSCAVHKAVVANVFLNLPHNERAFEETFGDDGRSLWIDFKRHYEEVNGRAFTAADETDFTPLWKLEGLTAEAIRPLSLREYLAYHAARDEHRLDGYSGRRPLAASGGLAWQLETLVDLLARFVDSYFPFELVGGAGVAATVLRIADPLSRRARIDAGRYFDAVSPVVAKILAAEALSRGTLGRSWLVAAERELEWLTRRALPADIAPRLREEIKRDVAMAAWLLAELHPRGALRREMAAAWLDEALRPELAHLRPLVADPGGRLGHFASPSIFHELASGRHRCSRFVRFKTVCTVMDAGDLVPTM